ncbi:MAG: metallophosphoesterase family protein [Defluviitaleaceae bacterium]|nr:metallophosphoesterase family protein [Defluviitaleaceae bacterium]MCL2239725.1 metallophosphoesterase family protein [Defluviitaleaceae bacterium]
MRTAIIADIHGNYPALMKVLEDARGSRVDNFIFLGDYAIYDFPWPNEVTRELMQIENAYMIRGNKEKHMGQFREERPDETINDRDGGLYHSVRELTQECYDYLHGLEDEMYIRLSPNALVYAKHVSPICEDPQTGRHLPYKFCANVLYRQAMEEKPFTREEFLLAYHNFINSDICSPYIQSVDANIIMYAHNHIQMHAYCGDKLIINPGSCGMPFDCNNKAAYTILEVTSNGFNVIEKRVEYDIEAVIAYTRSSDLYKKASVIGELNIHDLRVGSSNTHLLADIIQEIATAKNENNAGLWNCSDAVWHEAGERFIALLVDVKEDKHVFCKSNL